MLKSRSILSERQDSDGFCISVMSRHTLNDGITPDERITKDLFDLHLIELAPPTKLVGKWYRGELGAHNEENFESFFAPEYKDYLNLKKDLLKRIGRLALEENITFMCIEPEPKKGEILLCHRRLLVEKCKILTPSLNIEIK